MKNNSWLLIILVIALAIIPLFLAGEAEFGGADGEAEEVITEIQPDYEPWFAPFGNHLQGRLKACYLPFRQVWALGSLLTFGYKAGQRKIEKPKS